MNENIPTSKHSIISLVLGVLTALLLCASLVVPIPGTTFVCAPLFILLALLALIYGGAGLKRIAIQNERGRRLAWAGIFLGGFVLLCVSCLALALVLAFTYSPNVIPLPPFLNKYL